MIRNRSRLAGLLAIAVLMGTALSGCHQTNTETMSRAAEALSAGEYQEAGALYEAAVNEGKNLEASYRGLGIAQMGMMEYEEAAISFETALQSRTWYEKLIYGHAMEDDIRRYLAACYSKAGDTENAVALYSEMIEEDGKDPTLYIQRGAAYALGGEIDAAKSDFDRAINLDRNNYESILTMAQILEENGRKELGAAYLQEVPSLDLDVIGIELKGRILYFLEDYEGAIELLSEESQMNEETALVVCKCYQALGDTDSAMEIISDYGEAVNSSPSLLALLGSIYMQRQNYDEAISTYENAVTASVGTDLYQDMLFNRAVAYEYSGAFDTAAELLSDYVEKYPGDEAAQREMQFLEVVNTQNE